MSSVFTFDHNLNVFFPVVEVYDDSDLIIVPDDVQSIDVNSVTIDLSSFGSISGTWHASAAGGAFDANVLAGQFVTTSAFNDAFDDDFNINNTTRLLQDSNCDNNTDCSIALGSLPPIDVNWAALNLNIPWADVNILNATRFNQDSNCDNNANCTILYSTIQDINGNIQNHAENNDYNINATGWNFDSVITIAGGIGANGCTIQGGTLFCVNGIFTNDVNTVNISDANVLGDLVPTIDNAFDLGQSNFRWANIYGVNFIGSGASLTSVPASAITAGTFGGSTAYTFPQNLVITGDLTINNDLIDMTAANSILRASNGNLLLQAQGTAKDIIFDAGDDFRWRDSDAGNAERMTLKSATGFLGILTTSPDKLVHVFAPENTIAVKIQADRVNTNDWTALGLAAGTGASAPTKAALFFDTASRANNRGNMVFALENTTGATEVVIADAVLTLSPAKAATFAGTLSSLDLTVGDGGTSSSIFIDGGAATNKAIDFMDAGVIQWRVFDHSSTSDWRLNRYSSGGVFQDVAISFNQSSGAMVVPNNGFFNSDLTVAGILKLTGDQINDSGGNAFLTTDGAQSVTMPGGTNTEVIIGSKASQTWDVTDTAANTSGFIGGTTVGISYIQGSTNARLILDDSGGSAGGKLSQLLQVGDTVSLAALNDNGTTNNTYFTGTASTGLVDFANAVTINGLLFVEDNPAIIRLRDEDAAATGYVEFAALGGTGEEGRISVDPNNVVANSAFRIFMDNTQAFAINSSLTTTLAGRLIVQASTDSSFVGQVGFGTTTPDAEIDMSADNPRLRLSDTKAIADWEVDEVMSGIDFFTEDTSSTGPGIGAVIEVVNTLAGTAPRPAISFKTATTFGAALVENLRIDGVSGDVNIARDLLIRGGAATITRADTVSLLLEDTSANGIAQINFKNDVEEFQLRLASDDSFRIEETSSGNRALSIIAGVLDNSIRMTSSGVIINEGSAAALDFRVESDNEVNMLFVDAGNDAVGINRAAPSGTKLYVDQDSTTAAIPTVIIDQADISEGTVNFIASDRGAVTTASPAPTTTSVASVRIELNGTIYVIPLFADQ